jgi:hypothetical protein
VAPPYSERILDYSEFNLLSGRAAKSRFVANRRSKVVLHIHENGVNRELAMSVRFSRTVNGVNEQCKAGYDPLRRCR